MELGELKPIIDLMNIQEERMAKKIDKQEERMTKKIDDLHIDVKIINSTVAKHDKSINSFKAVCKFISSGIVLAGVAIGGYFTIKHK